MHFQASYSSKLCLWSAESGGTFLSLFCSTAQDEERGWVCWESSCQAGWQWYRSAADGDQTMVVLLEVYKSGTSCIWIVGIASPVLSAFIYIIHTWCPMVSVQEPVGSPLMGPQEVVWQMPCKKGCICTQCGPVPSPTRLLLLGFRVCLSSPRVLLALLVTASRSPKWHLTSA